MTHDETIKPSGKSYSHKFTHTSAVYGPTLMEWPIERPFAGPLSIVVQAYNASASSLTDDERIKWEIVDRASDPLSGGTALDVFQSVNNLPVDGSGAWESHTLEYTKEDDRPLILRAYCTRGSGNSYIYFEPQVASAGAGGNTQQIMGGLLQCG